MLESAKEIKQIKGAGCHCTKEFLASVAWGLLAHHCFELISNGQFVPM